MINFSTPAVVAGATTTRHQLFQNRRLTQLPLVALDGGADALKLLGLKPDYVIGDLDSIKDVATWREKTEVIQLLDQDSTDLEKYLRTFSAPAHFVFGCLDGRFDHTVEILHIFRAYPHCQLLVFSSQDVIFRLPSEWRIEVPADTRISFYPLRPCQIKEGSGLKYPVSGLTMESGIKIGTSNQAAAPQVTLTLTENNCLLGILPLEAFDAVLKSLNLTL